MHHRPQFHIQLINLIPNTRITYQQFIILFLHNYNYIKKIFSDFIYTIIIVHVLKSFPNTYSAWPIHHADTQQIVLIG